MADLKEAVGTVLEGWTLPHDVRKILETAYYADTHAPVQAEQSLEVVAEVPDNGCWRIKPIAPELPIGMKFADHAKATAALAQKDAEIAKRDAELVALRSELKSEQSLSFRNQLHDTQDELATLRAQIAEAEKDSRNWRQYQARKQAVIAAGMGKNPLRDAALSSQQEGEKACTT